jgi:hypothetical protein
MSQNAFTSNSNIHILLPKLLNLKHRPLHNKGCLKSCCVLVNYHLKDGPIDLPVTTNYKTLTQT